MSLPRLLPVLALPAILGLAACSTPAEGKATATAQTNAPARPPPPPPEPPRPRPTTGVEGEFTKFMKDNTALAAAINDAAKDGPAAARKVYEAQKDALKTTFDRIKNLRSDAVTEQTVQQFTENVSKAISDICGLGMGSSKDADEFKKLCNDYTHLLDVN